MKRLILLLAIVFLGTGLRAASVLPVGEGKFTYKDYPPFADRPVDVHYYIPASGDVRHMPIVFVFEGADRGYTYLLKAWKQEAEKHKFMVFIPTSIWKGFLYPIIRKSVSWTTRIIRYVRLKSELRHWLIKSSSTSANLQVVNGKDI